MAKKKADKSAQQAIEALQTKLDKLDLELLEAHNELQTSVAGFKRQAHCLDCLEQKLSAERQKTAELTFQIDAYERIVLILLEKKRPL